MDGNLFLGGGIDGPSIFATTSTCGLLESKPIENPTRARGTVFCMKLCTTFDKCLWKCKYSAVKPDLKIECRRKVTKCGFGSNAQSDPGVYGSEVPYHSCCLPYRVGFWVGPLGYSGPFSFWGSFLPIFSHFLNGSGSKNILDMAQTQNQKSKPSS